MIYSCSAQLKLNQIARDRWSNKHEFKIWWHFKQNLNSSTFRLDMTSILTNVVDWLRKKYHLKDQMIIKYKLLCRISTKEYVCIATIHYAEIEKEKKSFSNNLQQLSSTIGIFKHGVLQDKYKILTSNALYNRWEGNLVKQSIELAILLNLKHQQADDIVLRGSLTIIILFLVWIATLPKSWIFFLLRT